MKEFHSIKFIAMLHFRWYILDSKHVEDVTMTSILCGISSQSKENQTVHVGEVQVCFLVIYKVIGHVSMSVCYEVGYNVFVCMFISLITHFFQAGLPDNFFI